eukprot:scaffold504_cov109-Cylindrotheca_fusiformis.AAC.8
MLLGALDGYTEGAFDGYIDKVGCRETVGTKEGSKLIVGLGVIVGALVGSKLGIRVGKFEGETEGTLVGSSDGLGEGLAEGIAEGSFVGNADGLGEGISEGVAEGLLDQIIKSNPPPARVGDIDGISVVESKSMNSRVSCKLNANTDDESTSSSVKQIRRPVKMSELSRDDAVVRSCQRSK